jgi:hypothetical protein
MTQRVSRRTGRTYAQGSSPPWADWNPRDCYVCEERVYHYGPRAESAGTCLWDDTGEAFVWHVRCASGPPLRRAENV